ATLKLKHFDTEFQAFDLEKQEIDLPKIKVTGLTADVSQTLKATSKTVVANKIGTAPTPVWKINLGEIDLRKVQLDYLESSQKNKAHVSFKRWYTKIELIDLANNLVVIQSLQFENLRGAVALGKVAKIAAPSPAQPTATPNLWEVKINQTDVAQLFFQFDNNNFNRLNKGLDYNHIQLKKAHLKATNFHYKPESIAVNVASFAGKEQSGLVIDSLSTDFFFGPKNSYLKKLYLKTPQTLLRNQVLLGYPSIAVLSKNPGEISIKANLKKSRLGFKDLLVLAPQLATTNPFASNPKGILLINSTVSGKLNRIEIPNLEVSGIGKTKLQASGSIVGLPNVDQARFDIAIQNFESSAQDIKQFSPKGSLPSNLSLPNQLSGKGSFKGTIYSFFTDVVLNSSFGKAKVKATFDQRQKNKERYDAQAEFTNFDLGRLIQNKDLGKISSRIRVKGTGLDPKTATIVSTGTVSKLMYNNYAYQNLSWNGAMKQGLFEATMNANDPNLTCNLTGTGGMTGNTPKGNLKLHLEIADLEKLNLHAGPLKLKGEVDANILSADLNRLNGSIIAHQLVITNEKGAFQIDSIQFKAISNKEKTELFLNSSFIDATVEGQFKISQLATALQNSIAHYYNTAPKAKRKTTDPQNFSFTLNTKESPLFAQLLPEVKELAPIQFSGRYNSVNDSIAVTGKMPKLVYGNQTITNADLTISTNDNALNYSLFIDDIQNPQMQLPFTLLSGKVAQNQIDYALQLKDNKDKERYFLAGNVTNNQGNTLLHLDKNALLNYENWLLPENNQIVSTPKGLIISDFKLVHEGSSVSLESQTPNGNAPIALAFENFDIQTISSMVEKDDWQMSGKINGTAVVKNIATQPLFTSDVKIDTFTFKNEPVGDFVIQIKNENQDQYDAHVALTGQENDVKLDGTYSSKSDSFDLKLVIEKLNMKSIQGFSMGQLTKSTGFLSGNFDIKGTTEMPNLTGQLQFNNVGFNVKQLNANFNSINDAITFEDQKIILKSFTIKDEKSNDLIIDGQINTPSNKVITFDLAIDAKNFKAINSKAKDNEMFYGELFLDNHITIKGTSKNPIINGAIKVNKDTKFTIVVPQSDPSIADREGIVEFIDQDHPVLVTTLNGEEKNSQSDIIGLNASMDISVDKEAELTMIIDKTSGDFVKVKGTANLNGGIDASGKTNLTGKYELEEGEYEMTFSSIKRKFSIKKGSYILWKGEPLLADINITAVYKVTTAPIDLVANQIGSVSDSEKNTFKEKIPFETELKMTGEIMKPEIAFDIVVPENSSVSSKVLSTTKSKLDQLRQDPNEMNKQVFALLVLGNFMGENPLSSESGFSAESMVRGSASKILSNQLNNLAGDLINGIELNFDLQSTEDYSTGQKENKTDLNVNISKKLFNDRVKVTVGSNFELEGNQQANESASNIAGDVSIDYQITKDGRYKVRGYRVNKYQVALQGEVVETGVSFIITMDYNKFKELFQRSK
ncbi:MAG: translocation/assembly module TamB, partial [Flavobacterium sp.]